MPSARPNFRKSDTQRMIKAAQTAGLRVTSITLDKDRVVLQVADAAPATEPAPAVLSDPSQ
jgi:hypothetical protein